MISLQKLYSGAQDKYVTPANLDPLTIESEYLDTVTTLVKSNGSIPSEVSEAFRRITMLVKQDPIRYVDEYLAFRDECKQKNLWDYLAGVKVEPNISVVSFTANNLVIPAGVTCEQIGFTGLRFVGIPSSVKSIELSIGGNWLDTIYPSITGTFAGITFLNRVIPKLLWNTLSLRITFLAENTPLEVHYDRVLMKNKVPSFEVYFTNNQYYGGEVVTKGPGSFMLRHNNPIHQFKFLSTVPLAKTILSLDKQHTLHVPFNGMQNGMYLYEIHFNGAINFSRIDNPCFLFDATASGIIHPFSEAHNLARYMSGLGGLGFSR